MNYTEISTTDIIREIENERPVLLSRWGDGEWGSIVGGGGSSHFVIGGDDKESVGLVLAGILESRPGYLLGTLPESECLFLRNHVKPWRRMFDSIIPWIKSRGICDLKWVNHSVFTHSVTMNMDNGDPLLAYLLETPRQKVVIGPIHVSGFAKLIGARHIHVVNRCVMRNHTRRAEDIWNRQMRGSVSSGAIVLVSAGAFANVLVDYLHGKHIAFSVLDVGSYADFYSGVDSRQWIREIRQ